MQPVMKNKYKNNKNTELNDSLDSSLYEFEIGDISNEFLINARNIIDDFKVDFQLKNVNIENYKSDLNDI